MNFLANLFGLAGPQGLIILIILILLFGAKRLPELARGLGQSIREFKKGQEGIEDEDEKEKAHKPVIKP